MSERIDESELDELQAAIALGPRCQTQGGRGIIALFAAKSVAIAGGSLLVLRLLRGRSASNRSWVAHLALAVLTFENLRARPRPRRSHHSRRAARVWPTARVSSTLRLQVSRTFCEPERVVGNRWLTPAEILREIDSYVGGITGMKVSGFSMALAASALVASLPTWLLAKLAPLNLSDADLLQLVSGKPLDFEPGMAWRYPNTGYYLLGIIVEGERPALRRVPA